MAPDSDSSPTGDQRRAFHDDGRATYAAVSFVYDDSLDPSEPGIVVLPGTVQVKYADGYAFSHLLVPPCSPQMSASSPSKTKTKKKHAYGIFSRKSSITDGMVCARREPTEPCSRPADAALNAWSGVVNREGCSPGLGFG
eukprot:60767-Rhodomonas_salina.1